jgi:hypothetical protein
MQNKTPNTYIVRGTKLLTNGTLAKIEAITSDIEEANKLYNSAKENDFKVFLKYFSNQEPDLVRQLALQPYIDALGVEFFKGVNLDVRA